MLIADLFFKMYKDPEMQITKLRKNAVHLRISICATKKRKLSVEESCAEN